MASNKTCLVLLAVVVFISYIGIGSALECYTCVSPDNSTCGNTFNPHTAPTVMCIGSDNYCIKGQNWGTNVAIVTRSCGTKESCQLYNKKCHYCSSDKCNSSSHVQLQFMLLPLVVIAIVKSYL